MTRAQDEWLWGWDDTPGIVSVWAEHDGAVTLWRRLPDSGQLLRESARFRPWMLLAHAPDVSHAGASAICVEELDGPGELRYVARADDGRRLARAVCQEAERRLRRPIAHVRELGDAVLVLPPEEQYLVESGRTYFRGLAFDDLRRAQFDLETTGLDADADRIFLIAVRGPDGAAECLEANGDGDAAEASLIRRFIERVSVLDPDVIENHNLHGFDLPFLAHRARRVGVPLALGRVARAALQRRPASRGASLGGDVSERDALRRLRYTVPGRELLDSMDAVRRHDFSARDLPGHGLKAVARHFGLSEPARELVAGARVHEVYRRDPERARRYALADVHEAAAVSRVLGGAAFALARMVPRRYERLADAGPATGVVEPLLVRAYLRAGAALPRHEASDGTAHTGAALHLFATGVASRVVKADVASLYPSLMRQYRIGPSRDRLGAFLSLVDQLVEQRLAAKARARRAEPGSAARLGDEALSAAMKLVVNSAYGYLGAGTLTRFSDVHAANEVTRQGRAVLGLLCRALAERGVTLLEADTDGVYFAVPSHWTEADERRVVDEVAALLPPLVHLEFEGRYAAMLSHEPKNYALLPYTGALVLRGVAFRSSRAEPFGQAFLRRAIGALLARDVLAVRRAYVEAVTALRRRAVPTRDVCARIRLTKTPDEYLASREHHRELAYEALLANGRSVWRPGERIRVYRAERSRPGLLPDDEEETSAAGAPRDYDVEFYVHVLRSTFAARLVRAFAPEDFESVFADPLQPSLFEASLGSIQPILTVLGP